MSSSLLQSENAIFKQMAAQGQSMFAASGDSGADTNGSSLSVADPASQPYVVGVGGTQLKIGTDGSYVSESTWNGDGISAVWTIPDWQKGKQGSQPDDEPSE